MKTFVYSLFLLLVIGMSTSMALACSAPTSADFGSGYTYPCAGSGAIGDYTYGWSPQLGINLCDGPPCGQCLEGAYSNYYSLCWYPNCGGGFWEQTWYLVWYSNGFNWNGADAVVGCDPIARSKVPIPPFKIKEPEAVEARVWILPYGRA